MKHLVGGLSALALLTAPVAQAATLALDLDRVFPGVDPGDEPAGSGPWLSLTLDDSVGGPNTVRLTMSASGLSGGASGENIDQIYLNFDPALDPTALAFTPVDTSVTGPISISTGSNSFMSDGDGDYDILIDLPPPPGNAASRFTQGEVLIFDLTYTSAIDASSFGFFSDQRGGQGTYLAAAHVQRTPSGGRGSAWIGAVPEPGTSVLLGLGLTGLAIDRRRRG